MIPVYTLHKKAIRHLCRGFLCGLFLAASWTNIHAYYNPDAVIDDIIYDGAMNTATSIGTITPIYLAIHTIVTTTTTKNIWTAKIRTHINSSKVRQIGKMAFANCTFLSSVDFPYYLLVIGDNAFHGCI